MSKPVEQLTLSEILTMCAMKEAYYISPFEAEHTSLMAHNLVTFMQKVAARLDNKILEIEVKRHQQAEIRKQIAIKKSIEDREARMPFIMPD